MYRVDAVDFEHASDRSILLEELDRQLLKGSADYAFAPLAIDKVTTIRSMVDHGWTQIESRVTYRRNDLSSFTPKRRSRLREATPDDLPALWEIAVAAKNPLDRFHGDPFYTQAQVEDLMKEWLRTSVQHEFADCVLVPATSVCAFMTLRYNKDQWTSNGERISRLVLNAVHPRAHGWYPKLVSETLFHLKEVGAATAVITTQAANRPVIRTLEFLGFVPTTATTILRKIYG